MIVWKVTDGIASDVRHEPEDYALQPGEQGLAGFGELPSLQAVSDPAAWAARESAADAEEARVSTIRAAQEVQDMIAQLRVATPATINDWVNAQVTDVASARTMFKRILLVLAALTRGVV